MDLQTGIYLWLVHDSPPPDYLLAVQEFLNNVFLEQWIGGGGHLEPAVYAKEVSDIWDFQH